MKKINKVITDLKKETINNAVCPLATGATEVDTDDSISYVELKVDKHISRY
jgi:hypothetical protein